MTRNHSKVSLQHHHRPRKKSVPSRQVYNGYCIRFILMLLEPKTPPQGSVCLTSIPVMSLIPFKHHFNSRFSKHRLNRHSTLSFL